MKKKLESGRYTITGRVVAMKAYLEKDKNFHSVMQPYLLVKDKDGNRFWIRNSSLKKVCLYDKIYVTASWMVDKKDTTFARCQTSFIEFSPPVKSKCPQLQKYLDKDAI